jgi:thiol-disulfide isomerase/thioredoxin
MNSDTPDEKKSAKINEAASKPSKSRIWWRRGLELLLFVVLIVGVRAWQQRDIVKGEAPVLAGYLLQGAPFILPAKPAQPVLVHFWATWCPICRAEEGSIESLAQDNPNVITIAMQSGSPVAVQQYMREQGLSFPVINDPNSQISAKWGVQAVPASFIVDTEGKIRYVEIGYTTGIGLRLRLWLAGF